MQQTNVRDLCSIQHTMRVRAHVMRWILSIIHSMMHKWSEMDEARDKQIKIHNNNLIRNRGQTETEIN